MKRIFFYIILCIVAFSTACSRQAPPVPSTEVQLIDPNGQAVETPELGIGQAYVDALSFLDAGEQVMLIELDGWGWYMYEHARSSQPFLGQLDAKTALAEYPPVSQVGLATLLTGQPPDVHGIRSRNDRQLLVEEDIFAAVSARGKTAYFVEGDTALIETSLFPVLSPDLNGENGTDDEVFGHAMDAPPCDLLVVHFHGIDDVATEFGPYAEETAVRMELVDGYVQKLAEQFSGKIIVTADHGLHPSPEDETGRLGTHGELCAEDMLVPYIVTDGGGREAHE